MRRIVLFPLIPLLLLSGLNGFSQDINIDSLRTVYNSDLHDTLRRKAAYSLGKNLYRSKPDSALEWMAFSLKVAKAYDDAWSMAISYQMLGVLAKNRGELDIALENQLEALKLYEEIGKTRYLSSVYNDLGIIYKTLKQFDKALEYYQKGYDICKTYGPVIGEIMLGNNIGTIHIALKNYEAAEAMYLDVLEKSQAEGIAQGEALALNNLGELYAEQGRHAEAVANYQKTLKLDALSQDFVGKSNTLLNLGHSYSNLGNLDSAMNKFDKAIKLTNEHGFNQLRSSAYASVSNTLANYGRFEEALEYHRKLKALEDSLLNESTTEALAELETRFETEKKEKRIAQLSNEKALASLTVTKQRSLIFGLIGGILILALLGWLLYNQRQQKAKEELAAQALAFNKQLLDSTVLAEETERQRIAKELHDGLVQSLAALKLGIQNILRQSELDEEKRAPFKAHMAQIDDAAEEARSISHQMMPRALTESGLVSALEDMLHKTLGQTEIEYEFEHFNLSSERYKSSIEISLYRICQEMVNNVIKHSQAKHVHVQLYQTKSHLMLHIEDDGKGFEFIPKGTSGGIGLNNIFSRASAINGEVNFEKGGTNGTSATVRIPLEAASTETKA